jgi:hypothetical protein
LTRSVAFLQGTKIALNRTGFFVRNRDDIYAVVNVFGPPHTSNEFSTAWVDGCYNCCCR